LARRFTDLVGEPPMSFLYGLSPQAHRIGPDGGRLARTARMI
jgi:hypothetical protein